MKYLYVSSTSADTNVNYKSLYGISKFLSEKILLSTKKNNSNINLKILRLGMLYGLKDCPIRKIKNYRKFGIKLLPGDPYSEFGVSSAEEIINNLIDLNSELWNRKCETIYSIERRKISINLIHKILSEREDIKKEKLSIHIKNRGFIHLLANTFVKKIDLSLSEENRYPDLSNEINLSLGNFNDYISRI